MRLLRYYYYRVYNYYKKADPDPFFKTFAVVFVGAFFNFLALASITSIFLKIKFVFFTVEKGVGRLWPLLFILPLFGILFHYFKKQDYHNKIDDEFKNETPKQKFRSGFFVILYFVGTITLFVLSLWIREKIDGY